MSDQTQGFSAGERYERISRIATGGMGEVWRARDTVLGREVAVKVLKQEYADDPTFRARFAAEARNAASLHHANIAAIFDYGMLEGETPYLVMELVDGRPLSDLLAEGRSIDPEQARLLTLQVADGLAVAHRAGVVHRDIKPANLLVTPDGHLKITDFGIARAAGAVAHTQTGQIIGTPHYLSPEQARGETATARSDVYALGVVLFECLTGHRPYTADSPIATALAHIRDDIPPLPDDVPVTLARVVHRAMAKDPAERYADGGEFADALREAAGGAVLAPAAAAESTQVLSATAAVPPVAAVAPSLAADPTGTEPGTARVTTTRTRNRWPLYLAALLAVIVAVALLAVHPWTNTSTTGDNTGGGSGSDTVRVRAAAYVGKPVAQVEDALAAKGLKTRTRDVADSGGHQAGTVAALDPTGLVKKGSTITLDVWRAASTPSSGTSQDQSTQGPGNGNGSGSGKTKAPKPQTSKAPKPQPPGQSKSPGGGNSNGSGPGSGATGGAGGATGSAAPGGRGDGTASKAPAPSPGKPTSGKGHGGP